MSPGPIVLALACVAFAVAGAGRADDLTPPGALPKPETDLTGRDIYERVLDNSFDSFVQESSLVSGDRAGNSQESRFKMWFQNLRDPEREQPQGTVIAKSMVQYTYPFDIRYSGYLIHAKLDATDDQFVYLPSQRRMKRINLRGRAVFGTDFSFEDILPHHIEDADYDRLADQPVGAIDCYVVEAVPKPQALSEYSRARLYIDKQRFIPLLTRYWDERRVPVKELSADPSRIERIEGVWVTRKVTMRHLRLESYTTLQLTSIQPNVDLPRTTFDLRRLESH